jgi:hypothetical protein
VSPADVAEMMVLLTAAYPDHNFPDAAAAVYQGFLADLDGATVKEVIVNHVATHKWFPKISEIREAALERELNIDSVETVLAQIQGEFQTSRMGREALQLVGGDWERRRTTNPSAWRAQFKKAYEGLREAALHEKRQAATQGLLAQFTTKKLKEDDNARPARLTGEHTRRGYFCHHCHRDHEASTRCPAR